MFGIQWPSQSGPHRHAFQDAKQYHVNSLLWRHGVHIIQLVSNFHWEGVFCETEKAFPTHILSYVVIVFGHVIVMCSSCAYSGLAHVA